MARVADAWSRTYRSHAVTSAATPGAVDTLNGMRVIPEVVTPSWPSERLLPPVAGRPAEALDGAFPGIATRYDAATAGVVAMQLEYPQSAG